ncbi:MAG: metallophosphoesterase, partial [Verrucomicrobiae bacterium]
MRLLLTSDLHRDGKKLLWLLDEAPEHDALLVAGDLLDIFSNSGFIEQKSGVLRCRNTFLKSRKSLAWCSGNHDFFNGDHGIYPWDFFRFLRIRNI